MIALYVSPLCPVPVTAKITTVPVKTTRIRLGGMWKMWRMSALTSNGNQCNIYNTINSHCSVPRTGRHPATAAAAGG